MADHEVRQRHVGVVWLRVLPAVVVPVLLLALVVPQLPPGHGWQRWLVAGVAVVWLLWGAFQPLLWWWGADLRIDDEGLHFGTRRRRRKPAQITFAARNPYDVAWSSLSDVRLVRSRSAVLAMRKAARDPSGPPQPTTWLGYFPARGRAALAFRVEGVAPPEIRPASTRRSPARVGKVPGVSLRPNRTWVFPVARVEPVLEALQAHGVVPTETDDPVLPDAATAVAAPGPDDPFVVETMTRNLGRPMTDGERDQLRRDWHDTQRFPHRSPEPPG